MEWHGGWSCGKKIAFATSIAIECLLHLGGTYDFGCARLVSLTPLELCERTKPNGKSVMCKRVDQFLVACDNRGSCLQNTTYRCLACVICKATGSHVLPPHFEWHGFVQLSCLGLVGLHCVGHFSSIDRGIRDRRQWGLSRFVCAAEICLHRRSGRWRISHHVRESSIEEEFLISITASYVSLPGPRRYRSHMLSCFASEVVAVSPLDQLCGRGNIVRTPRQLLVSSSPVPSLHPFSSSLSVTSVRIRTHSFCLPRTCCTCPRSFPILRFPRRWNLHLARSL